MRRDTTGRPRTRAWPSRRGPHAGHGPGRPRRHHRVDRRPPDRRRTRRIRRLLLAVLRLPARRHRHPARLRQALRHLRPQTRTDRRDHRLPHRIRPVRLRLEHGRAHRLPHRAGPRRRRPPGHRPDHRRRPVPAQGTPQDPGQVVHGLGDLLRRRSRPRRTPRQLRRLALDLPHQRARRSRRAVADRPAPDRTRPPHPHHPPEDRLVAPCASSPPAPCCSPESSRAASPGRGSPRPHSPSSPPAPHSPH